MNKLDIGALKPVRGVHYEASVAHLQGMVPAYNSCKLAIRVEYSFKAIPDVVRELCYFLGSR